MSGEAPLGASLSAPLRARPAVTRDQAPADRSGSLPLKVSERARWYGDFAPTAPLQLVGKNSKAVINSTSINRHNKQSFKFCQLSLMKMKICLFQVHF